MRPSPPRRTRRKRIVVSAAVLALAISGAGVSQAAKPEQAGKPASNGFKVTGGGQIISEGSQGPGDTVGFVAQDLNDDGREARGQFQFNPGGQSGDSAGTEKFHGTVTCLLSGGEAIAQEKAAGEMSDQLMLGMARFGGFLRDDPTQSFTVDVSDDGQGNGSNDMILVRLTGEPCADNPEDEDGEDEDLMMLGRGNVKIHNNPDDAAATAGRMAN